MNRKARRQMAKAAASYSIEDRLNYYFYVAMASSVWDITDDEQDLAKEILSRVPVQSKTFYHGGSPHLPVGETLLPSCITGYDPRGQGLLAYPTRTNHVYVTTNLAEAGVYAAMATRLNKRTVYQVLPHGDLGVDVEHLRAAKYALTDYDIMRRIGREGVLNRVSAFTCRSATVFEPIITISDQEARELRTSVGML